MTVQRLTLAIGILGCSLILWAALGMPTSFNDPYPQSPPDRMDADKKSKWTKDATSSASDHHGSPLCKRSGQVEGCSYLQGTGHNRDEILRVCTYTGNPVEQGGRFAIMRAYNKESDRFHYAWDRMADHWCSFSITDANHEWHQTGFENRDTGRIHWERGRSKHN